MKRRSEAEWRQLFTEQEVSGLPVKAFCLARGLNPNYFRKRHKQLSDKEDTPPLRSFVPVTLTGPNEAGMMALQLDAALRLQIPASVSPRWLAELIHHLRT